MPETTPPIFGAARTMLTVTGAELVDAPIRAVGPPRIVVDGVEHEIEGFEVEQDVEEITSFDVPTSYFVPTTSSMTFTTTGNVTFTLPTYSTGATTYNVNGNTVITFDVPRTEPTPEQRDQWEEDRRRRREEQQERDRQRRTTEEVAERLLLSVLDEVQTAQYRETRGFEVTGSHGGRYVINWGTAGNVYALEPDGKFIGALCCYPRGGLPVPDVMLAQALHLMSDEPGFVDIANVHRGNRPQVQRGCSPDLVLVDEQAA